MGSARRRERQHVGLRAARGEHHVARLGSDQRGDLLARILDQPPGGAALGMHRGRIAGDLERGHGGGARLLPQRSGCIPVEVDTLGHGL